jgi:hypothetical protein
MVGKLIHRCLSLKPHERDDFTLAKAHGVAPGHFPLCSFLSKANPVGKNLDTEITVYNAYYAYVKEMRSGILSLYQALPEIVEIRAKRKAKIRNPKKNEN